MLWIVLALVYATGIAVAFLAVVVGVSSWKWHLIEEFLKQQMVLEAERESMTRVTIDRVSCAPFRGEFACFGLTVFGSPGAWAKPEFCTVRRMTCGVTSGFLGTLSMGGMQKLPLTTHVPFVFGFKGKMIDSMHCEGVKVHVEYDKAGARSNVDFLTAMDKRDRKKSMAKQRKTQEAELRWRIRWTHDKEHLRKLEQRLTALLRQDLAELVHAGEDQSHEEQKDDADHAAFMHAVHGHLAEHEAHRSGGQAHPPKPFEHHHAHFREKLHKKLAEHREKKSMRKTYEKLKATDFNEELMHVGRCGVADCEIVLRGSRLVLDGSTVMIAFSGTMRQFQRAVAVHVLKKTMYDTLHQRSSAASHHYTAKLHGVLSDGHATIHRASTKAKKALTAKSIARAPYKLAKRASTSARTLFRKRSSSGESARADTKGTRSRSATADSLDEADAPRESNADLDGGDGGDGDFEDAGGNFDAECTADP